VVIDFKEVLQQDHKLFQKKKNLKEDQFQIEQCLQEMQLLKNLFNNNQNLDLDLNQK